jgi:hypothetical protein
MASRARGMSVRVGGGSGVSVLQLSMRKVHDLVGFCALYEFEDVVADLTGADRIEVEDYDAVERARRVYKLGRLTTGSKRLAAAVTPRLRAPRLTRDYDLFFPVFNHPFELFALATIPDWRARCRVAACFVAELWSNQLPGYLLELLADFDHVFVGLQHPVGEVARLVGRPCKSLPLAADVLRFAPSPAPSSRSIDVCYIGRRSAVTHAALTRLARQRHIFYYYDTVRASGDDCKQRTFRIGNVEEHRMLLASLLQRSRYYVANRARVNESLGAMDEISSRFYEGIAAGAVLVGDAPRSPEFLKQFDWLDAVVHVPFDSPGVGDVLAHLDAEPNRVDAIRQENVRQAAARHDWLHRLETVFAATGVPPTEAMRARALRLREAASSGDVSSAARREPVLL